MCTKRKWAFGLGFRISPCRRRKRKAVHWGSERSCWAWTIRELNQIETVGVGDATATSLFSASSLLCYQRFLWPITMENVTFYSSTPIVSCPSLSRASQCLFKLSGTSLSVSLPSCKLSFIRRRHRLDSKKHFSANKNLAFSRPVNFGIGKTPTDRRQATWWLTSDSKLFRFPMW